jgi:hypothetical protein
MQGMTSGEASHASQQNDLDGLSSDTRIKVMIDEDNQVVGDTKGRFKSLLGKLVRAHIPIIYTDWRKVLNNYKDDVWTEIQVKHHQYYLSLYICF